MCTISLEPGLLWFNQGVSKFLKANSISYDVTRKRLVLQIANMVARSGEGHIPSALSILDIVYAVYDYEYSLGNNLKQIDFVLSKGHGAAALYVVLNEFGAIPKVALDEYCQSGGALMGHPEINEEFGIRASTGSLGHGFPIAVGLALGNKILDRIKTTYVVIGDGEANEGTIWESLILVSALKITNLICFLDNNLSTERAIPVGNWTEKFKSFGWNVLSVDGHDLNEIKKVISEKVENFPTIVITNTVKGRGLKDLENNPSWHHRTPTSSELQNFESELNQN